MERASNIEKIADELEADVLAWQRRPRAAHISVLPALMVRGPAHLRPAG